MNAACETREMREDGSVYSVCPVYSVYLVDCFD
jgi:hypothetical protein